MRQQRLAGHLVQDLRHDRAHPRALAGRKHDGQAGPCRHPNPLLAGDGSAAALLERFAPAWKPDSLRGKRPGFKMAAHFLLMFAL
jgi:hypothetical protein